VSVNVQRSDLFVGMFLVSVVALVVAALVATSGWGTDRYDIYVRTDSVQALSIDTKIFLQGLEVGRITAINPRPAGRAGQLEFILRLSLLDRFPDGTPLRLPRGTDAEVVQAGVLGGSLVQLSVRSDSSGTLAPGDTIDLRRAGSSLDAFGALARDLKSTIEATLVAATGTLNAFKVLSESLTVATGTARRFLVDIQPGTQKIMAGVAVNLDRMHDLLDSTNTRTGITMQQVDSTIVQSRVLIRGLDSLARVFIAMGGDNRPEIAAMIVNFRELSEQLQYVLDQIGRRPLRAIFGVRMPDSLAPAARDSVRRTPRVPADSLVRPAPRDSTPARPPTAADSTRRPPPDTRHPTPDSRR
jgi:hypothetical protein